MSKLAFAKIISEVHDSCLPRLHSQLISSHCQRVERSVVAHTRRAIFCSRSSTGQSIKAGGFLSHDSSLRPRRPPPCFKNFLWQRQRFASLANNAALSHDHVLPFDPNRLSEASRVAAMKLPSVVVCVCFRTPAPDGSTISNLMKTNELTNSQLDREFASF